MSPGDAPAMRPACEALARRFSRAAFLLAFAAAVEQTQPRQGRP